MKIALVLLAAALFVTVVWIVALDRSLATALRRTEDLDARLREHGL